MAFQPIAKDLLFSKHDPLDPRRGERVRLTSSLKEASHGVVISGYPDDEGIRNGGGRPGASQGPDTIRQFLYRMVATPTPCFDLGNLEIKKSSLKERHEEVRLHVTEALKKNNRHVGLGGGHDYGYADGAGFLDWAKSQNKKTLLVNFDAHLDVRPETAQINSGTPFYRLSQLSDAFDLVQIGIQKQCNSDNHFNWSRSKGHTFITLDEYWNSHTSLEECVSRRMGDLLNKQPCFLSIDIDSFAWPYAIGASQSWPTGLEPKEFWPCFELLLSRLDVRALGIYETSPPLDFDFGTAKLAAQIADTFIRSVSP